jgi:hypothetical protein
MEQQAPNAAAVVELSGAGRGFLCGANKIVDIHVDVCQRKRRVWE